MSRKSLLSVVFALVLGLGSMQARAGIPVIDAANLVQAIQQVMAWTQQYQQMAQQLASVTGDRGMQNVMPVSNTQRNYLPTDYQQLMQAVNGASSSYAGLSGQVQSIEAANAVLSSQQLAALSPSQQQTVLQGRQAAAMLSAMTQSAQQNSSQRFAGLQQLVSQIGATGDTKASADLQARIGAEQAMLANEQTKLQSLYQTAQAQQMLQQQQIAEQVIAGHGDFKTRFQPSITP